MKFIMLQRKTEVFALLQLFLVQASLYSHTVDSKVIRQPLIVFFFLSLIETNLEVFTSSAL